MIVLENELYLKEINITRCVTNSYRLQHPLNESDPLFHCFKSAGWSSVRQGTTFAGRLPDSCHSVDHTRQVCQTHTDCHCPQLREGNRDSVNNSHHLARKYAYAFICAQKNCELTYL